MPARPPFETLPTIAAAAARLRDGRTTAVELVEGCLAAIARLDGRLNAFITVTADAARAAARQADGDRAAGRPTGPLHGIPVSIKDLLDLRGLPTTAASRVRAGHRAAADAPVLAALRRAGAIFIGKCNLHEFAFGTTGADSAFGPTRNPHAPAHSAGGSSSGSAVSVATGMALASVGTDTGGSVRIPAAACGVVGLKPTFGELSCDGVVPLARTLDHVGPLALTVGDAAVVYRALAGGGRAPAAEDNAAEDDAADGGCQVGAIRLGLPRRYFLDRLDAAVRTAFEAAVGRLRAAGAQVAPVEIPHAAEIARTYRRTQLREAAEAHAATLRTRAGEYSPEVRRRLEQGLSVGPAEYERAQQVRATLRREVDAALAGREALILPTLPIPAPRLDAEDAQAEADAKPAGDAVEEAAAGSDDPPDGVRALMLRLTQLFNLTGHPAISIPCGTTPDGLPCAVQLVGRRGATGRLLALAARCEGAVRGWE